MTEPGHLFHRPCNWGVLGTAAIARKVVAAMHAADNASPMGIASRTLDKAEAFAVEHGLERPYAAYEELLADPDIDAVYIPLPTTLHREWTIRAAEAGKHVLCEKPVAPSAEDARAMVDACRANDVQFMDGVMFMHHERLHAIERCLPEIGERPSSMISVHSFKAPDDFFETNIRVNPDTEPLGCVGDLAWYNVRFTLLAMGWEMPIRVQGVFQREHQGVPTHATAEVTFEGGTVSVMQASFLQPTRQWFEVCGPQGTLNLRDFVHGPPDESTFEVEIMTTLNANHTAIERAPRTEITCDCAQEVEMIRRMSDIAAGNAEQDRFFEDVAVQTQVVVDAIMASARRGGEMVELG
ncbi:MAG: Gfo/Idh/MocA family oxidoreductase [Phycisphaerales bacterium]|nr:Gfo/Idh/MocA family oxidoreductase [Phycisphaerales bacterium]